MGSIKILCDFSSEAGILQVRCMWWQQFQNNPGGYRQWPNATSSSTLCSMTSRGLREILGLEPHFLQCMCSLAHSQKLLLPLLIRTCAVPSLFVMTVPVQTKLGSSALNQWDLQLNDCWASWILLRNKSVYLSLKQLNLTRRIKPSASKHGKKAKPQCYRQDYAKNWHRDNLYLTPVSGVIHVLYQLIFILWYFC